MTLAGRQRNVGVRYLLILMRYLPVLLSCVVLAAHHLRAGEPGLIGLWLSLPLALRFRRRWADRALQLLLLGGAGEWLLTLATLTRAYALVGRPCLRVTLILGSVAAITALSGLALETREHRRRLPTVDSASPGLGAFLLTAVVLMMAQLHVQPAPILLERFLRSGGWWQGAALAFYAGWLADRLGDPGAARRLRPVIWIGFSAIFFLQLVLGMAGVQRLLMTGDLHLPVPALIAAGPIYRGDGFFMAILFTVSVLALGPAWCSWLCYVGAWDDRAARLHARPRPLPSWRRYFRLGVVVAVAGTALLLRYMGVSTHHAAWWGGGFGVMGIVIMAVWSRRTGQMTHCTTWCPMGWLATRLGRLSPWRLRISESCVDCGACTAVCHYDALSPADLRRRRPGEACTLCGDCQSVCATHSIQYHCFGADSRRARRIFFLLVAVWHAVFLGMARL